MVQLLESEHVCIACLFPAALWVTANVGRRICNLSRSRWTATTFERFDNTLHIYMQSGLYIYIYSLVYIYIYAVWSIYIYI